MLIGVTLIVKVDYLALDYFFFKKNVAVAVLHTYADQTSVLRAAKFCPVLNK